MQQTKLNREKELETILVLCVAFLVIYFLTKQQHTYLLKLSIGLGLIGMFSKYLTSKISWAWLKLGEMMGAVMSKVILSVVFFGFLFPIALLSRVFSGNKNILQLKKPEGSYYFSRNHKYESKDLKNLW
ncbi:MAG: hypothetical protein V4615_08835 [Bacteroidota bacterium]